MIYAITSAFIVLDFLTGAVQAVASGQFSSTKMRQGLFHKVGLALCVILGVLIDSAQGYLDLGIPIPVATAICAYICITEASSIIENICKINPNVVPEKLLHIFRGEHDE